MRSCNFLSTLEVTIFCNYSLAISYRLAWNSRFNVLREHRTVSEFKRVAGGQ